MYLYDKTNDGEVSEIVNKWKPKFTLTGSIEILWRNVWKHIFMCAKEESSYEKRLCISKQSYV